MRDIRSDLEERAKNIDDQIRAAYEWFDQTAQQLQRQRDERVAELQDAMNTIAKIIEFENRSMANVLQLETTPPTNFLRAVGH